MVRCIVRKTFLNISSPSCLGQRGSGIRYLETTSESGKPFSPPLFLNLVERYSCAAREQSSGFTPSCAEQPILTFRFDSMNRFREDPLARHTVPSWKSPGEFPVSESDFQQPAS